MAAFIQTYVHYFKIVWLLLLGASAMALLMKLGLFYFLRMPTVQPCTCIFPQFIVKVFFVNYSLYCTDNSEGKQFWKRICDFPMQTEKRAQSVCCFTMLNIRRCGQTACVYWSNNLLLMNMQHAAKLPVWGILLERF